jgi:CheY-like chemotaxis protein
MLNNHFASRNFDFLNDEASGQEDGCNFFFYKTTSPESKEKLKSLCKEASMKQKLVIFSSSLDADSDSILKELELPSWIHCCFNPLGPSTLDQLDHFLCQSSSSERAPEPSPRSQRRGSGSKQWPDYPEHTLMSPIRPTSSQKSSFSDKASVPVSPITTRTAVVNLSTVSESDDAIKDVTISPTEANARRHSSYKDTEDAELHDSAFSVLIVEDNPINMRMLEACVKKTRCSYKVAFDGKQAVEMYKEMQPNGPSVVLLDISLPIMDGFEACKAMRAYSKSLKAGDEMDRDTVVTPRIVAITALSSPQDVESGLAIGMDEWRVKPANLPKLTADLVRWKKEWQATAPSFESPNDIGQS